jgi:hypothetical protein
MATGGIKCVEGDITAGLTSVEAALLHSDCMYMNTADAEVHHCGHSEEREWQKTNKKGG